MEVIVIGLALSASSLLAFHLYKRYKPTNPALPLYTAPAPRFYAREAIRIRGNYRGWGPARERFRCLPLVVCRHRQERV
ncbi:hypothetical protein CPB84DRAFT_1850880 [Gymnopilus junonius]|uniref:Uncharacterized protein n=1 Tax=Gymnopilus junonius TaxID=109634 RepID=A0A9P5NFW6_GYMJU|nr:hypothetical protein CPB84DRAFT_1850880 [Gymnopilus junonius]